MSEKSSLNQNSRNFFDINDYLAFCNEPRDTVETFRVNLSEGYYENTIFPFLPGIYVFLNDVHTKRIPIDNLGDGIDFMIINYCISGRCEFRISENNFGYIKDYHTSIGPLMVSDAFHYPSGYYLGFEIYILKDFFTAQTREVLDLFCVDPELLLSKYNADYPLYIGSTSEKIQKLWMELYTAKTPKQGLIRLNILKILHSLLYEDPLTSPGIAYLTKKQSDIAKETHRILTEDLGARIPMRKIAERFHISETSLKNYFSAVYGMPVSQYMTDLRMKQAALWLSETNLPISEIASACGYANQGRFANVFREYYGLRPLEYRHNL